MILYCNSVSNYASILTGPADSPVVVLSDPVIHLNISNFNLSMKCMPEGLDFYYLWEKKAGNLPTMHMVLTHPM